MFLLGGRRILGLRRRDILYVIVKEPLQHLERTRSARPYFHTLSGGYIQLPLC